MQFQLATDYALRILRYMHESEEELSTAVCMSEKLGITYLYFMKIISRLKAAGLVKSVQGCNGGYSLCGDVDNVSVYDVVCIMEGGIHINRCLQPDGFCSRGSAESCKVHEFLKSVQTSIVDQLKNKKICEF